MSADLLRRIPRVECGGAWDDVAGSSQDAWVQHLSSWISAYLTWGGMRDLSFAVLDPDGKIAAIVPCFAVERRVGPIQAHAISLHGGPAFRLGLPDRLWRRGCEAMLAELDAIGVRYKGTSITAQLPPVSPRVLEAGRALPNPLWQIGFADSSTATWMVSIGDAAEDKLWDGMDGRARTAVRKALKSGITVVDGNERDWLEHYVKLHRETADREGLPGMPAEFFQAIWNDLIPRKIAHAYFAIEDEQPIAAIIIFMLKGAASYNSGAGSRRAHEVEANSLLLWHALKVARTMGCHHFDFGEAVPVTASGKSRNLSDFKRSFGGELYPLWRGRRRCPGKWLPRLAAVRSALSNSSAGHGG